MVFGSTSKNLHSIITSISVASRWPFSILRMVSSVKLYPCCWSFMASFPVSYTHLDVYKRQILTRVPPWDMSTVPSMMLESPMKVDTKRLAGRW